MTKKITALLCAIAVTGLLTAEAVKKNDPSKKEVEALMKEIGGDHYQERMKFNDLCSLKYEDSTGEDNYWHIYVGETKKDGYHVIIYNNVPEYLGFYKSNYEPVDYEEETVLLDSEESDSEGGTIYIKLPISAKGPALKVRDGSTLFEFKKNPLLEPEDKVTAAATGGIPAVPKQTSATGKVIDYRDWKITMKGREITVNAIFVKLEKGNVTLKSAKNGRETSIPGSALSEEDKEYVRSITAK